MTQKLNDTQRKLVEDNHNLIYFFLKSNGLSLDDTEDWYGTAAIGLCKAALAYDESKNSRFAALAHICMANEVINLINHNQRRIVPDCSLDYEYDKDSGGIMVLSEIIPDTNDYSCIVYLNDAIELATNGMSDRDKQIIDLLFCEDKTQTEVGKMYGLTRSRVQQIYKMFIEKVRDYYNN